MMQTCNEHCRTLILKLALTRRVRNELPEENFRIPISFSYVHCKPCWITLHCTYRRPKHTTRASITPIFWHAQ
jgi:hypothetical protein